MKFYVLDLDLHTVDDWHRQRVEIEAPSASSAAEDYAADSEMDVMDDATCTVAVSEEADGNDAEKIVVKLRIRYDYVAHDGDPIDIPPLRDDDEDTEDAS